MTSKFRENNDTKSKSLQDILLDASSCNICTDREKSMIMRYRELHQKIIDADIKKFELGSGNAFHRFCLKGSLYKLEYDQKRCLEQMEQLEQTEELQAVAMREKIMKDPFGHGRIKDNTSYQPKEKECYQVPNGVNQNVVNKLHQKRLELLKIWNLSEKDVTPIEELAIDTMMSVNIAELSNQNSIICASELSCCDAIVFALFLTRAIFVCEINNFGIAEIVSNRYITLIITATKILYPSSEDYFDDLFENRTRFYDEIFTSDASKTEKFSTMNFEFNHMLINDRIDNKFEPYNKNSGITIVSIFEDLQNQNDISEYNAILDSCMGDSLNQVCDLYGDM